MANDCFKPMHMLLFGWTWTVPFNEEHAELVPDDEKEAEQTVSVRYTPDVSKADGKLTFFMT